ncbi:hypothetical protein MUK42_15519 [Musa troglodytarum]|uniref:Uncharacterized protein n=1 Tax=Musa troglodytarum TaxID=320322 RepID=A0A9E7HIH9_9LILI|nr:hypothetical protein MUK42_15519 [Musa troglodytarum]
MLIHGVKWGPRRSTVVMGKLEDRRSNVRSAPDSRDEEKSPFPLSSSVPKLGRVSEEGGEEAFGEHTAGPRRRLRSRRAPTRIWIHVGRTVGRTHFGCEGSMPQHFLSTISGSCILMSFIY